MKNKLAVLLGAMLAMMVSGCANITAQPPYNPAATAERIVPCGWYGSLRSVKCHPMSDSLKERWRRR